MPRHDVRQGLVGLGLLTAALFAAHSAKAQTWPPVSSPEIGQAGVGPGMARVIPTPGPQWEPSVAASPQGRFPGPARPVLGPIDSLEQLVRMSPAELDRLYRQGAAVPLPVGQARGRTLFRPGTSLAVPLSRAAKVVWQGKVIHPDSTAVNRFFGVKIIKGNLFVAESWLDGGPSLILDYSQTSIVYANYRDEIREVAPGLFLGLMYARTSPRPTLKMYFALQAP